MDAVQTDLCNNVLTSDDPDVGPLPCQFVQPWEPNGPCINSFWMPTEDERQMLINGAGVLLTVSGPHPAVCVRTFTIGESG